MVGGQELMEHPEIIDVLPFRGSSDSPHPYHLAGPGIAPTYPPAVHYNSRGAEGADGRRYPVPVVWLVLDQALEGWVKGGKTMCRDRAVALRQPLVRRLRFHQEIHAEASLETLQLPGGPTILVVLAALGRLGVEAYGSGEQEEDDARYQPGASRLL
jgi:hypothetical protein